MLKIKNRSRATLVSGTALLAFAATTVSASWAQTVENGAENGDIVVTAQRREEKLSKVPVSVVAFGAEMLKTRVINSEQDMGSLVPGLQVKNGQNSNQLSFSMRGQTLDPFSGTSPAVLTYVNEAPYIPGNTSTAFFDLGSIQVLKGPQGTLFGRNATGGAVLYSTPMPGDDFGGYLTLRAGERNSYQAQGAVDLPIAPGKLAVRLAFDYTKADGYIKNVNTGNTLGDKDSKSGRATIVYTPTETIKNTLMVQYNDVKGTEGTGNLHNYYTAGAIGSQFISNGLTSVRNNNGYALTSTLDTVYNLYSVALKNINGDYIGDSNLSAGPAYGPGRWPGGVEGYAKWSQQNPYKIWLQFDLPHKAHNTYVTNSTEIEISDNAKIKNIFSYMKGYAHTPGNLAGGPFGALWLFNFPNNPSGLSGEGGPGGQTFRSENISEELQLQGSALDDRLDYTAGVYYSKAKRFEIIPINVGADLEQTLADVDYTYRNKNTSKAVFGQVSYKVTDKLTAVLGGRYTWETVGITQAEGNVFNVSGLVTPPQRKKLSAPAWTASLQYQIDNNNMVYFSQRGSFRAGNFNGTVNPAANFFKNEKVHDFELGYKFNGRIGGAPVQFNTAVYEVIVKNAQHAVYAVIDGNPAGFTLNVPESKTKGVEVDAAIGLTDWLDLSFNGAYTDAKYTKNIVDMEPLTGVAGYFITFDSYPDSPRWSGSAAAVVKLPVPESIGKMSIRADYYKQTKTYFSSNEGSVTPGTKLDGYSTVNLRYDWKDIMNSKVSLAAYVRNVGDKMYYISGYAMGASGGYNTAYPGEPRTFGAELSVKF
ncbi:TonB-dependent receptor [Aquisediminimonas sediminicola]|uniref:TonB-dependent receptor n=1 Tax=Alteraquisediminimonas sediminicola TaxID=2676787 RepID=UPI001FEB42A5|nr:TonB-dependent receptor [Aquisediminimonas sediminicola]